MKDKKIRDRKITNSRFKKGTSTHKGRTGNVEIDPYQEKDEL